MVAAWVLDSSANVYNMDFLAHTYLDGYTTIHYDEVVPKGSLFSDIPLEKALPYAAEDADITLRLYHLFSSMLEKEGLDTLFYTLESIQLNVFTGKSLPLNDGAISFGQTIIGGLRHVSRHSNAGDQRPG